MVAGDCLVMYLTECRYIIKNYFILLLFEVIHLLMENNDSPMDPETNRVHNKYRGALISCSQCS